MKWLDLYQLSNPVRQDSAKRRSNGPGWSCSGWLWTQQQCVDYNSWYQLFKQWISNTENIQFIWQNIGPCVRFTRIALFNSTSSWQKLISTLLMPWTLGFVVMYWVVDDCNQWCVCVCLYLYCSHIGPLALWGLLPNNPLVGTTSPIIHSFESFNSAWRSVWPPAEERPGHPACWNPCIMQTVGIVGKCASACADCYLIQIPLRADGTVPGQCTLDFWTYIFTVPSQLRQSTLWRYPSSSFSAAADQLPLQLVFNRKIPNLISNNQ